MGKKIGIGLALSAIVIPGLVICPAIPASAQPRNREDYCHSRARRYSRRNASGGAIKGAVRGAIIGGVVSSIAGGSRRDRRRASRAGAAIGLIGGGSRRQRSKKRHYRREYNRCMKRDR